MVIYKHSGTPKTKQLFLNSQRKGEINYKETMNRIIMNFLTMTRDVKR